MPREVRMASPEELQLQPVLTVNVHDDGSGVLWADVEELPGVFATGDDLNELREAVQEAVELYLDIKIVDGEWRDEAPTVQRQQLLVTV
jgi:predicted RNase H-like HicB family nuclease